MKFPTRSSQSDTILQSRNQVKMDKILKEIWATTLELEVEEIGDDDSFFLDRKTQIPHQSEDYCG